MKRITLIAGAIAVLTACQSTVTGNEGNFQFSYWADDRVNDFNKPIAVGAFLDLEVEDVGAQRPVALTSAEFDDPNVLVVDSFTGNVVTVQGTGEGSAELSVAGTTEEGEALTDSVNLLSRIPEVLVIRHTCGEGGAAHYLADQRIWIPWDMEMANSQPVIGYGYFPITVDGTAATHAEAESGQQWMAFDTGVSAGIATIESDIDDSTLTIDVVTEDAITGVEEPIAFVLEDIDVGDTNPFYVLPNASDVPICQADVVFSVMSDTNTICDVRTRVKPNDSGDAGKEYGWFEIEGLATGTCLYTVTYPGGASGAGAWAQFSYEIQP